MHECYNKQFHYCSGVKTPLLSPYCISMQYAKMLLNLHRTSINYNISAINIYKICLPLFCSILRLVSLPSCSRCPIVDYRLSVNHDCLLDFPLSLKCCDILSYRVRKFPSNFQKLIIHNHLPIRIYSHKEQAYETPLGLVELAPQCHTTLPLYPL